MPVMVTQAKAGKVTPLAATSRKRSPALPELPTMMEAGVPDYEIAGWFGILAPANTPPASPAACGTRWRRRWRRPMSWRNWMPRACSRSATQPQDGRAYLKAELETLREDHQGREHQTGMTEGF